MSSASALNRKAPTVALFPHGSQVDWVPKPCLAKEAYIYRGQNSILLDSCTPCPNNAIFDPGYAEDLL